MAGHSGTTAASGEACRSPRVGGRDGPSRDPWFPASKFFERPVGARRIEARPSFACVPRGGRLLAKRSSLRRWASSLPEVDHRRGRRCLATWVGATCVVAVVAASGCGTGTSRAAFQRETGVYTAVLRAALAEGPTTSARSLVFIAPLDGGSPPPLEVQAGVIAKLTKQADTRFVDHQAQAIDTGTVGQPVLGGGVLFDLGAVPASGTVVEVSAERYRSAADQATLRFSVRAITGGWVAELVADQPRVSGG
jgi:hypothetical protein